MIPGAVVRREMANVKTGRSKPTEAIGEYVLELGGEVVATAGFLLHYNKPFADLWMEVREDHRGQGLGSYALQEVKKEMLSSAGRIPAARCNMKNSPRRVQL